MSIDITPTGAATGIPVSSDRTTTERQEIKRLAQEFEAVLMTQMLREMRRSMLDDEDQEDGLGASTMTDTGDIALSNALSAGGGIGLADSLLKSFEEQVRSRTSGDKAETGGSQVAGPAQPVVQRPPAALMPAPVAVSAVPTADTSASDAPAVPVAAGGREVDPSEITDPARVSSGFGWRRDPIDGTAKFHKGIDIAVAYGHDVKAAAGGRVAFAGVQRGYGQTVIIDHEGGRQTRYAHLSAPLVKAGDIVSEGDVVARSGNSGRSTGPHLHFEMLVGGQPVDPSGQTQ